MKSVLLCGVPGTGKTTATKHMIEELGGYDSFTQVEPVKLVRCMKHNTIENFYVMGVYDDSGEVFQGTDRLSMAVQPAFEEFIRNEKPTLFVEGDRLVGNKTIDFLLDMGYTVDVVALTAEAEELQRRYAERGSDQSEKFIRSKETKVSNIMSRLDLILEDRITEIKSVSVSDIAATAGVIIDKLEVNNG